MSGAQGLLEEGCCCEPVEYICMPPFYGGNSCGAGIKVTIDWTNVKRQQWDNTSEYASCGIDPEEQCCWEHRAECDTSIPQLVGTYCDGGTLPCSHGDVTETNICLGCYNNLCNLWVAPSNLTGYKTEAQFHLCAYGYTSGWLTDNFRSCSHEEGAHQAGCNTQLDANTVFQTTEIQDLGDLLAECTCEPDPCGRKQGRTQVLISHNNAVWRIGGWCKDASGNILYPQRSYASGCLGNSNCPQSPSEHFCKHDKSYCAMASNNLISLVGGYTKFAEITRTYPMGDGAASLAITTAGTGYTANDKVQLVYVSGGASAPNPYGEPFIEIDSVNGAGGITGISLMTNGEGDKISTGQIYSVPNGTSGLLTVDGTAEWDVSISPWYRIKLRTIPVAQSQLQTDPDDYALAYQRCKDLLQVTDDLAHYCKYKDCEALPFTTPCPEPCQDFEAVTNPLWVDTNYEGTGFQSDLHFMGRTIVVDGVDEKTPWVTLAFHVKWVLNKDGDVLIREEIKYHCFGTQLNYEQWWATDSSGSWTSQGTVEASKSKLLWLGIRGDNYNIADPKTGVWYDYADDHHSECNNLQGLRGPNNPFCPSCTIPYCTDSDCLGDYGKWLPDNSDEVRIQSMDASSVVLQGRPRYHYKYQLLHQDQSSFTSTEVL